MAKKSTKNSYEKLFAVTDLMNFKVVFLLLAGFLILFSLNNVFLDYETRNYDQFNCGNSVIDIDGNEYETVKIGDQCWFAENLKVSRYRDGTEIPRIEDHDDWWDLDEGARTVYDHKSIPDHEEFYVDSEEEMFEMFGYLYNFDAVIDERGLCPEGWTVPSDEDWKDLEIELGMDEDETEGYWYRGDDEGDKLKGGEGLWDNSEEYGSTGFNALPGGYRRNYGDYGNIGTNANFWTSTDSNSKAIRRNLYWENSEIYRIRTSQGNGLSVRCLKDNQDERPINLEKEVYDTKNVNLSWDARKENVDHFSVYRKKKGGSYSKLARTSDMYYEDVTTTYGEKYYYKLSQTVRGEESRYSEDLKAVTDQIHWSCGGWISYNDDIYRTVEIGDQCWFVENLRTEKYSDGEKIPNPESDESWREASENKEGAFSCYDNDPKNCEVYGALYNAYAVMEGKLCPDGWSIPTDEELKELEIELGMDPEVVDKQYWRGYPVGVKLMGNYMLWEEDGNRDHELFGESGFDAQPGGHRMSGGRFSYLGARSNIWSSTIKSSAWRRTIIHDSSGRLRRTAAAKGFGFSARCLKDRN